MNYTIKAHPTLYRGVIFRSRLEATWAAFFDLAGWCWDYEPVDLEGWTPDFRVEFPCGHSDCDPTHAVLLEVKPYDRIAEFDGHPCREIPYAGAFGSSPRVTEFELVHGCGGGIYSVDIWVRNSGRLWREAGNLTRWHPR